MREHGLVLEPAPRASLQSKGSGGNAVDPRSPVAAPKARARFQEARASFPGRACGVPLVVLLFVLGLLAMGIGASIALP